MGLQPEVRLQGMAWCVLHVADGVVQGCPSGGVGSRGVQQHCQAADTPCLNSSHQGCAAACIAVTVSGSVMQRSPALAWKAPCGVSASRKARCHTLSIPQPSCIYEPSVRISHPAA